MRNQKRNLLIGLLLADHVNDLARPVDRTTAGRARHFARRARDRLYVGRRHLDRAARRRSPAVARLLVSHPATESRPLYSPTGNALAFVSTRTGNGDIYVLRFADASLTRLTFDDGAGDPRWVVAGRQVDLLFVDDQGHRRHERRVPSLGRRRHADAGHQRALYQRILQRRSRPTAAPSRSARAASRRSSGGATATVISISRRSGWPPRARRGVPLHAASSSAARRRCGRCGAATASRCSSCPIEAAARTSGSAAIDGAARQLTKFSNGPRAVAEHHGRRQDHRVRAGLRHLDPRHRERPDQRAARWSCAVWPRRLPSITSASPISSPISRSRPTARRSRSSCAARCLRVRRRMAAMPSASPPSPAREFGVAWAPDSRRLFYVSERDAKSSLVAFDFATRVRNRPRRAARTNSARRSCRRTASRSPM